MKRSKNPLLFGQRPKRTLKILDQEESDSDSENANKHIYKKIMEQRIKSTSRNNEVSKLLCMNSADNQNIRYSRKVVNKINTDSYIIFSSFKDGSDALKNELSLSFKRMRAAKHGHELSNSLQTLRSEFYTPLKNKYLIHRKAQFQRILKENRGAVIKILENSPVKGKYFDEVTLL